MVRPATDTGIPSIPYRRPTTGPFCTTPKDTRIPTPSAHPGSSMTQADCARTSRTRRRRLASAGASAPGATLLSTCCGSRPRACLRRFPSRSPSMSSETSSSRLENIFRVRSGAYRGFICECVLRRLAARLPRSKLPSKREVFSTSLTSVTLPTLSCRREGCPG